MNFTVSNIFVYISENSSFSLLIFITIPKIMILGIVITFSKLYSPPTPYTNYNPYNQNNGSKYNYVIVLCSHIYIKNLNSYLK